MPVCPSCGALQPGGASFCDECGAGLEVAEASPLAAAPAPVTVLICSNCYAQLEPVSRFCHMCGRPVRAATPPSPSPTSKPTSPVRPLSGAPAPSPAHPPGAAVQGQLVVHDTNAILPLPPGKTQVIIGREDPVSGIFPDIDLTNYGGDEGGVSRCHARIIVQRDEFFIEDLNSTNCTYVNQQQLAPEQPHPLNPGDEIQLGRLRFNFESPPSPPAP
jgi:hypothetical protein